MGDIDKRLTLYSDALLITVCLLGICFYIDTPDTFDAGAINGPMLALIVGAVLLGPCVRLTVWLKSQTLKSIATWMIIIGTLASVSYLVPEISIDEQRIIVCIILAIATIVFALGKGGYWKKLRNKEKTEEETDGDCPGNNGLQ